VRGATVSSSLIRRLVGEGKVGRAGRFLGAWYLVEGAIVGGAGRGRQVTVPTLNLATQNELLPKNGVYVSRISLDGANYLDGITNIGVRPTFGENRLTIETHALSAPAPESARLARLQFLHRLRDEQRFDSPQTLLEQIARDAARASKFFRILKTAGHARSHSS
jgi:riboflavin kinase/FMN adenylyltransferase